MENVVHSFVRREGGSEPSEETPSAYTHNLRALNAALVILFYRRSRGVHPAILESQVGKVNIRFGVS